MLRTLRNPGACSVGPGSFVMVWPPEHWMFPEAVRAQPIFVRVSSSAHECEGPPPSGAARRSTPVAAVEGAVLDRFRYMRHRDRRRALKVGDGPRNFEDAVMGPRRQPLLLHGPL